MRHISGVRYFRTTCVSPLYERRSRLFQPRVVLTADVVFFRVPDVTLVIVVSSTRVCRDHLNGNTARLLKYDRIGMMIIVYVCSFRRAPTSTRWSRLRGCAKEPDRLTTPHFNIVMQVPFCFWIELSRLVIMLLHSLRLVLFFSFLFICFLCCKTRGIGFIRKRSMRSRTYACKHINIPESLDKICGQI